MNSRDPWLLLLDLDGTLWDHLDISMLKPPFIRISEDLIIDSLGVKVKLYEDIVKVIKWAKREGAIIAALSWNIPWKAIEALRAFNLLDLFDYLGIEDHPGKGSMALKIVRDLESRGYRIKYCRVIYIDDRIIHVEDVREKIGDITFIKAWTDFRNEEELRDKILLALQRKC